MKTNSGPLSAGTWSIVEILILVITLLANHQNLDSTNSSKPPSRDPNRKQRSRAKSNKMAIQLVVCPISELTEAIDSVLSKSALSWDFDELYLYNLSKEGSTFYLSNSFVAVNHRKDVIGKPSGFISWSLEKIRSGKPVTLIDYSDAVPIIRTDNDRQVDLPRLTFAIAIPLKVEGTVRGCLIAIDTHKPRQSASDLTKILADLGEILAGTLERQRTGLRIHDYLRFETLLSDISSTYINTAPAEVEHIIRDDLGRLARFFGTDRCALYLRDKESNIFRTDVALIWWPEEDNAIAAGLREWIKGRSNMHLHFHYYFDKWSKGEPQEISSLDELPREAHKMKEFYQRFGVKSALSIPFGIEGSPMGALVIADTRKMHQWPKALFPRLRLCGEIFANALARKRFEENLKKAFHEIEELKNRFESDYLYLRKETTLDLSFNEFIGKNENLRNIKLQISQVASTNTTVLLLGETGTGKGVIASIIHNLSARSGRPLVQINCAALSPHLIESELFGHEKGAFTGAISPPLSMRIRKTMSLYDT